MTRPAHPRAPRAPPGFTLVEMLAVVAILGIVLMSAVSSMDWLLPDSRLSSAARELASVVEDARDVAIMEGRTVWVDYDLGENEDSPQSYRTLRAPRPGDEEDRFEDFEADLTLTDWRPLPAGVRLTGLAVDADQPVEKGFYRFECWPDGTMSPYVAWLYCAEIDGWQSVVVQSLLGVADARPGKVTVQFLSEDAF